MRELYIGIDSGTQSTKALVVDAKNGKVRGSGQRAYGLIKGLPAGAKEQHPQTWKKATAAAIKTALKEAKASSSEVKGIGVSGQQHGFVPLDKNGEVIRAAKLWCDTTTTTECDAITRKLGGLKKTVIRVGNAMLPGFTAPKIAWLKKHEPKNYKRLALVLLPHDYLNFWLTGRAIMEYGDASGTALFDVARRKWSTAAINAIDPKLELATAVVSKDNQKGKHTTTGASLIAIQSGGFVVDTPGIRQFQLWDVIPEEVAGFYREIRPFINRCKFPDCTHVHESDCGVKHAVADGLIDIRRYDSYCQIRDDDSAR